MTLTFGYTPQELRVVLSRGASFSSSLRRSDGEAWPAGLQLSLDFDGAVWPADLNGPVASWTRSADEVDAVLTAGPNTVRLWYVAGDRKLLWATGQVSVR